MTLENVISTCCSRDLAVWKVAAPRIVARIRSQAYTLIVPAPEVPLFVRETPGDFTVVAEAALVGPAFRQQLRARVALSPHGLRRYGWYLQQFVKLAALKAVSAQGLALIWDADAVPLNTLSFVRQGRVAFYKGHERHEPYFRAVDRLLGMPKRNDFSFIAQCLPCKGSWARQFFALIEQRAGKSWKRAVLDSVNFGAKSGFSEYETLGTFVHNTYPDQIVVLGKRWCRRGNGLIGSVRHLGVMAPLLRFKYDYISFERWDRAYSHWFDASARRRINGVLTSVQSRCLWRR